MIFHLTNGEECLVRVGAPTMGFRVVRITLDHQDLRALSVMNDLQEYLNILRTRFSPSMTDKLEEKNNG